jgi:hypothetical protein
LAVPIRRIPEEQGTNQKKLRVTPSVIECNRGEAVQEFMLTFAPVTGPDNFKANSENSF